ncbi:MAG TPA: hypothetical protein ENJ28_02760 [Gammaproteobacteria bacterium]|nr:hypothetical protein [Gammaproteobacteria bacterium]
MKVNIQQTLKHYVKSLPLKYQHIYVHPCVINKQPCIVYPSGLEQHSPDIFRELKKYFRSKGFSLKEEQRTEEKTLPIKYERRRWMPMLLFTASMLLENIAVADTAVVEPLMAQAAVTKHQVELRFIPNQNIAGDHDRLISTQELNSAPQSLKSQTSIRLYKILEQHYKKQPSDPGYIVSDLKRMATYYSQYPQVVSLIVGLKQKEWLLQYDENTWSTIASGSVLQVDKATIHFNTRSAAKLKLHNSCKENPVCIASPADALLHELLHTSSMLLNTNEFIKQGGMNKFRYPFKHEYAIIKKERELYTSMSRQDGIKRPQRNEHSGRKIIASCVTCIK